MVAHTNNPSSPGPVVEGFLEVQDLLRPHSEFQARRSYRVRSCQERMWEMVCVGSEGWGEEREGREKGAMEN